MLCIMYSATSETIKCHKNKLLKGAVQRQHYGFNFAGCEITLLPTMTSCDAILIKH